MRTEITIGYVLVYVPEYDCEGGQRTIDFPRMGYSLYGQPRMHWIAKKYLAEARVAAKKAIAAFKKRQIMGGAAIAISLLSGCTTTETRYVVEYRADAARPAEGVIVAGVSGGLSSSMWR